MMVAEIENDDDLLSLCTYISENPPNTDHEVKLFDDTEDSNWPREIRIEPVNISQEVGNWCLKLQNTGLVVQDVVTNFFDYKVDTENQIDIPGKRTTYVWMLRFQPEVLELKRIVESLRAPLT